MYVGAHTYMCPPPRCGGGLNQCFVVSVLPCMPAHCQPTRMCRAGQHGKTGAPLHGVALCPTAMLYSAWLARHVSTNGATVAGTSAIATVAPFGRWATGTGSARTMLLLGVGSGLTPMKGGALPPSSSMVLGWPSTMPTYTWSHSGWHCSACLASIMLSQANKPRGPGPRLAS